MRFDIITIFPNLFDGFKNGSLLARAQKKPAPKGRGEKLIQINTHYLRKWTTDRHQTVDDKPYGGGVGMLLKVEPIYKAVKSLKKKNTKTRVILLSPRGKKLDQKLVKRFTHFDQLIFICGRYEGVDERVADYVADETVSVGDYILSGGEVAAMAIIETVSRLIPGVIGKEESAIKFDHAQYTRPEVFKINGKKRKVPKVLLSGHHKKIEEWRKKHLK